MSPTFFAALVYLPQFMQKILGYSPVEAGLGLLPMMGVFAVVSFLAGPLYERLGPRPVLAAGAACLVAGPLLISLIETGDSWAQLVPGMVLLGAGVGLFYSAVTTAAVTALDPSRASLAGGIVYMFQVGGGSVGLGIATTVFTARAGDGISSSVERVVRDSFESGFQATFLLVAGLALVGFLVTVLFVGRSPKRTAGG
jgi:MFS family permease